MRPAPPTPPPEAISKRQAWLLIVLLFTAFALRAGCFLHAYASNPGVALFPDSPTYEQPARALLELHRFAETPQRQAAPEVMRTPGYPLFIAASYWLFGALLRPLLLLQIGLSVIAIYLVFWLGWRLRGTRLGLCAALIFALDPASFFYAQALLSETLYTFALLLLLVAAINWRDATQHRWLSAALLGLLCACAAHIRPLGYFMALPLLLWMLVAGLRLKLPRNTLAASLLALVLPSALLLGGWQWRNHAVANLNGFSAITGMSMLDYRAAGVVALRDHITLEQADTKLQALTGDLSKLSPGDRYRIQLATAQTILRAHPLLMLRTQATGLLKLLFGPAETGFWRLFGNLEPVQSLWSAARHEPLRQFAHEWLSLHPGMTLLVVFGLAYTLAIYLLSLASLPLRHINSEFDLHLLFALSLLYLLALSAGPEAYARFRVPAMPLFALYAALGLSAFTGRRQPKKPGNP